MSRSEHIDRDGRDERDESVDPVEDGVVEAAYELHTLPSVDGSRLSERCHDSKASFDSAVMSYQDGRYEEAAEQFEVAADGFASEHVDDAVLIAMRLAARRNAVLCWAMSLRTS